MGIVPTTWPQIDSYGWHGQRWPQQRSELKPFQHFVDMQKAMQQVVQQQPRPEHELPYASCRERSAAVS